MMVDVLGGIDVVHARSFGLRPLRMTSGLVGRVFGDGEFRSRSVGAAVFHMSLVGIPCDTSEQERQAGPSTP